MVGSPGSNDLYRFQRKQKRGFAKVEVLLQNHQDPPSLLFQG